MKRLAAAALLAACTTVPREPPFEIRASHYQSMVGVALQSGEDRLTCNRESITGSHILRWYCRFGDGSTQYQLTAPVRLILR